MKIILTIQDRNSLTIELKQGSKVIDLEHLTISQDFDTMLIRAIDKLLARNRIDRLSLKTFEIPREIKPEVVSNMIIKTVKSGLESLN